MNHNHTHSYITLKEQICYAYYIPVIYFLLIDYNLCLFKWSASENPG